jgi:polysaccharide export outer membrane protein
MEQFRNESSTDRAGIQLRIVNRQAVILWIAVAALSGLSLAQDWNQQPAAPSQAECQAAYAAGRPLPAGCAQPQPRSMQPSLPQSTPVQPPQLTTGQEKLSPPAEQPLVLNPSELRIPQPPPKPQTEFEQMVADTVGRPLPLFGQSLFLQPPSTFAPTIHAQVPDNYIIGPNDELQIRIWGQLNADLRVVVDRSGQIYIPHVGPISVAGVRYSDLSQRLKAEVQKLYRNFDLSASVARIRSIQVYVVGQARDPGAYTISSLSTLVNAVFASGGPTPQGSLRDIQVQREGQTIAHMDLYDLLVRGDKSKDVALQTGDVIYYPPVGPLAAVSGSVNAPAIYELRPGSTLDELLEIAGGLSTVADSSKVSVERIVHADAKSAGKRTVLEFPLDKEARALPLSDGDIVRVFSIVPSFSDSVTLRGHVANPGRYPWKPGMRIRDLIPNADALLTRRYWLGRASLTSGLSTEYPVRSQQMEEQLSAGQLNPAIPETGELPESGAAEQGERERKYLSREQAGTLADRSTQDTGAPPEYSSQQGSQNRYSDERTNPNVATLTADLHRASPEINWSYAIVQRLNPVDLSTRLLSFDLGKAVLEGDPANNLALEPNDIVTVFSQRDVSVPQSLRTRYVRLEGEVRRPGVYKVEEGEQLRDVIQRAGGVTPDAFIYGTVMTRESARKAQQKSLDELTRALEVEVRQASVAATTRGSSEDRQVITARQAAQEALIAQLRNMKATGRIVLNLSPSDHTVAAFPAIPVEDNDRIVIPHVPSTVAVTGMVYNPGSFIFSKRRRVGDYLKMAGKGKPNADMHHSFVLHANGTVTARTAVNSLFTGDRFAQLRLSPGDQIVVPNKIATGNFVRGLRDWTQISSQLALTGAALAVIH